MALQWLTGSMMDEIKICTGWGEKAPKLYYSNVKVEKSGHAIGADRSQSLSASSLAVMKNLWIHFGIINEVD